MITLFFSYSHKDEALRDQLDAQLAVLKREGLIDAWHDRRILAGAELDETITSELATADVVLCLVSSDFLNSDYCMTREMQTALANANAKKTRVIPVIARHCDWQHSPLRGLRASPRDGKPISAWGDIDEALLDVVNDIRAAIADIAPNAKPTSPKLTPSAGQIVSSKPRSSNLHVHHEPTDNERDDFLESSFDFLAEFFNNSLEELHSRQPRLKARFKRVDAHTFTACVYRDGRKESGCTIALGSDWGRSKSISISDSDDAAKGSANELFSLAENGRRLAFRGLMGSYSGEEKTLNREQVAEAMWGRLMAPLQRN